MTTKLFFIATVFVLASARTATAGEGCLEWPFGPRPESIIQHFHETRPGGNPNHNGIDVPMPQGTVLPAVADGTVVEAGKDPFGANVVTIRVGSLRILYGHLSQINVAVGDKVWARNIIGNSGGAVGVEGSGSKSKGPHLHLSVYNDAGQPIDPEPLFCR